MATGCDLCGALFKPTRGTVHIGSIGVGTGDKDGSEETWTEIDLCPKCGEGVLEIVRPAFNDSPEPKA